MVRLGIIGCGNIGRFVMRNLAREDFREFSLQIIADLSAREEALRELAATHRCAYTTDPASLALRKLDVVLEAARPDVVKAYVPGLLRAGTSVLALSVGAFADPDSLDEARQAAREGGSRLLLPTGAIAGLDHLKAAGLFGVEEATLTLTKNPEGLADADYFDRHPVDLRALTKPTLVFEGSAAEAIREFPTNVNVAVALSLATLGPARTRVRIVCDPAATCIRFEIRARGVTGEIRVEQANLPSPDNPRTSYQACCSALATLKRFVDPVQLGT
jgi:aspartate dehydrogenase